MMPGAGQNVEKNKLNLIRKIIFFYFKNFGIPKPKILDKEWNLEIIIIILEVIKILNHKTSINK